LASLPALRLDDPQARMTSDLVSWLSGGLIAPTLQDIHRLRVGGVTLAPAWAGLLLWVAVALLRPRRPLPGHFDRIPAARARSRHCPISRAISAPNSSGVLPTGSTPSRLSRSARSAARTARCDAAASLSITGFGVPAGATMPIHRMPS